MTTATRPNVFVGPRPFRTGERLFGRAREITDLTNMLMAERVVLLYSASGAGKSSLIQAGLVPRLRPAPDRKSRGRVFDVPTVHPSNDQTQPTVAIRVNAPLVDAPAGTNRYVFSALASLESRKPRDLQFKPAELAAFTLSEYLAHEFPDGADRLPVFLAFDQFEEILTLDPTEDAITARRAFFEQLGEALRDRRRWALIAIREDYLAGFDPYLSLLPNRLAVRYRLGRLSPDAALEAILEPPRGTDLQFDPDCAKGLVGNLRQVRVQQGEVYVTAPGPDVEPVHLQVVCKRLWEMPDPEREKPGLITTPDFQKLVAASKSGTEGSELSGVDAILAGYYASKVAEAAGAVSERRIRDWFERELITRARTRKPVPSTEHPWVGLPRDGLEVLDKAYLIREDSRGGVRWLELAHDRLVEPVLRDNAQWRAATLKPFQLAAAAWAESKERRDEMLVSGEVLKWGEEHSADLTNDEKEFLRASQGAADRQRARARMWLSWGAAGVLLALLVTAGVVVVQYRKQARAQAVAREQERQASLYRSQAEMMMRQNAIRRQTQAELRVSAAQLDRWGWAQQGNDEGRPPSAASRVYEAVYLLSLAYQTGVSLPEAENGLRQALQRLGWQGLTKFSESVTAVAFSPSGRWLAVGGGKVGETGSVDLWRLEGGQLTRHRRISGQTPEAFLVAADESSLWVRTKDDVLRYSLPPGDTNRDPTRFRSRSPNAARAQAMIVPVGVDGRGTNWVVTIWANGQGEALWCPPGNAPEKRAIISFDNPPGLKDPVVTTAVGFAPRSSWVYTGTADGRVLAWNLSGSVPVVTETGIKTGSPVTALAVHPGGKAIAVGEFNAGPAVWHLSSPSQVEPDDKKRVTRLMLASGSAVSLSIHPRGNWLALTRADRTVELLLGYQNEGRPTYVALPVPPPPRVSDPALATVFDSGADGTSPGAPLPERLFLAGAPDGTVRLWDLTFVSADPIHLIGPTSGITVTALSPDRSLAVVGCEDGTVHMWDLRRATGRAPTEPRFVYAPGGIRLPAVSQDGRWAAGTDGLGVWVWDLREETPVPKILSLGDPFVEHLLIDGSRLTPLSDRSSDSWDLTRPEQPPVPNPAYAKAPKGTKFVFTPDHKWAVGLTDEPGQVPQLLLRRAAAADWARHPLTTVPARANPSPKEQISRGPHLDPPLLAIGGPGDGRSGDRAVTMIGVLRRWPYFWRFDPELGRLSDPVQLPLVQQHPPDRMFPPPAQPSLKENIAKDSRPPEPFTVLTVSPDGRFIAAAAAETIRVWQVNADGSVRSLPTVVQPSGQATALAFSPDGKQFAIGGTDGTVRIWNTERWSEPLVLTGHTGRIQGVHFTRQELATPGKSGELRLVTFGEDCTMRVWTLDRKALVERALQLVK